MNHDPLCTMHEPQFDATWCHDCRLIVKARADERDNVAQIIESIKASEAAWPPDSVGHWSRGIGETLGLIDEEPDLLLAECYDCNGEQLAFQLAISEAVKAICNKGKHCE